VQLHDGSGRSLTLVRLYDEPKKLRRVIHEGKLDIYDEHLGFLRKPEDIDLKTVVAVYNNDGTYLYMSSLEKAKIRLTRWVNNVYGVHLDPANFSWDQLMSYIDKLD
jgi:hypothetical protein